MGLGLFRLSKGAIFGTHFYAKGHPELISQGIKEMGRDEENEVGNHGIWREIYEWEAPPREGSRAESLPAAWPVPPRPNYYYQR